MKEQDIFWNLTAAKIFNELNPDEENHLKQLLGEDENQKIYEKTNKIHQGLKKSQPLQSASPKRSWKKVSRKINARKIHLLNTVLKYAAIIILAFLAGKEIKSKISTPPQIPETIIYTELKVPLGQMSEVTLSDGSQIWLNSGTILKYPNTFGVNSRNVFLDGEAYFEIQKSNIPFKVKLKNSEIEVLGTSFSAISYADMNTSQVTLVEGSVQINSLRGTELAKINPEEQITIPDDLSKLNIKKVETDFYSSWTEGKIVFNEERLADIAFRLERWYNVEINFASEAAGNLRFSGTILKNKPFDQITKAIGLLLPINIKYQNNLGEKDIITISKK